MKRGKTEKEICEEMYTTTVKRVFPFFGWKECDECHVKFRYEFGWKYLVSAEVCHMEMGVVYEYGYLCKSCAPSLKTAYYLGESRCEIYSDGMSGRNFSGGGYQPTKMVKANGKRPSIPPPAGYNPPPPAGRKKPSPPPNPPPPPKDE